MVLVFSFYCFVSILMCSALYFCFARMLKLEAQTCTSTGSSAADLGVPVGPPLLPSAFLRSPPDAWAVCERVRCARVLRSIIVTVSVIVTFTLNLHFYSLSLSCTLTWDHCSACATDRHFQLFLDLHQKRAVKWQLSFPWWQSLHTHPSQCFALSCCNNGCL